MVDRAKQSGKGLVVCREGFRLMLRVNQMRSWQLNVELIRWSLAGPASRHDRLPDRLIFDEPKREVWPGRLKAELLLQNVEDILTTQQFLTESVVLPPF